MAHRQVNVSRGTLFFTLFIVSVVLQLIPHKHTKRLNVFFRSVFDSVLSVGLPRLPGVFRPALSTEEFVSRGEHNELWKAYNNTHAALIEMHRRYEALAQVRSRLPNPGPGLVLARVATSAISGFAHELNLNEGSAGGIKTGQLVLCGNRSSIIGSVSEVRETTATVRLLTDSRHTIMVAVWREGRQDYTVIRQMVGDGKDRCKIPMVSRQYDIRVGDAVFASAEQGLLDTPIVIGEVSEVKNDENKPLLLDITVRPILDPEEITEVAVIVMQPRES